MSGLQLSVRQRLTIMMSVIFFSGVLYLVYDLFAYRAQLIEQKQNQLGDLAEAQSSQLSAMLAAGISEKAAFDAVSGARYDGEEYFFIIDQQMTMLMHPFKPQLNGMSVSDTQDPDGVYLFRDMKRAVQGGHTGFVSYKWPRPGSEVAVDKLSAVTPVAGTDMIIGTGVYIDDVAAQVMQRAGSMSGVLVLWIALMAACSSYFNGAVQRPVKRIEKCMERLADGDLSASCEGSSTCEFDHLSKAMNSMREKIGRMIKHVAGDGHELREVSSKLDAAVSQVSGGSAKQHSELDQLSVAMTEMLQTTQVMAHIAREAAKKMSDVTESASYGERSVENVRDRVHRVLQQLESAAVSITQMNASAEQISNVAGVIASISEQTNLLALNAAIEAARAGESGRGFAVVADEVRTLAQRTGVATNEIKDVIDAITQVAQQSVVAMRVSADETRNCAEEVDSAQAQLAEISAHMTEVKDLNLQVAASVTQQEQVAAEMNRNLAEVAHSADDNRAASDNLSSASTRVARLSDDLARQLSVFRTTG